MAINSGQMQGGQGLALLQMIRSFGNNQNKGQVSAPTGLKASAPTTSPIGVDSAPQAPPSTAVDRAVGQDPNAKLYAGLDAVNDPNLPIPYEDRMHIADKLLRAKHGISDGEWQNPQIAQQGQGQIKSGSQQGGNPAGLVGTVAALV